MQSSHSRPFVFPQTNSPILPDPSAFFSPGLLSSPLPTNSFFHNFAVNNGDQPEYIHPYHIKSSSSSISISYPFRSAAASFIPDLTISSPSPPFQSDHIISSFNDLSVTVDLPPSLRFFLVRGSPFVTASTLAGPAAVPLTITSIHAFQSVRPNSSFTKHTFELSSGQTFLCYSSSPLRLEISGTNQLIATGGYAGFIRIAFVPDPSYESVLDQYSSCYPVSGDASFTRPGCLEYRWEKKGRGDLLLLAHAVHLRLLDPESSAVLENFKYRSIDGDLVGVVADSWLLKIIPVATNWCSTKCLSDDGKKEIISALSKDINALNTSPIQTTSPYFYGKAIARAARLALIAHEANFSDGIPTVVQFLRSSITPWLDGSFTGNRFLYESKWGGIISKKGTKDSGEDLGLGYFLYAIAALAKFDPAWGTKFRSQAYSIMSDFMSLTRGSESSYARLRRFDLWKLHSSASGLTEFAEAANDYYSAALLGLSYGHTHLAAIGSTLAALEIVAAETWRHDWRREIRMGSRVPPLLPITGELFGDVGLLKEMVAQAFPELTGEAVAAGWKGFVYAMEGVYNKEEALVKIRSLKGFDDGNSLSNLLWWVHSREDEGGMRCGWFGQIFSAKN
ncbi:hypothetical protein KSP39_PZI018188 [Platanthera zijinensis]|uniref:glucan endo-1,3-beta-D-glucosidase n=1 Tax=Platanthera zijinensis TaxID=2320716 RepID=A0AAP0B339_9ASPA